MSELSAEARFQVATGVMVREEGEGKYLVVNQAVGGVFVASATAALILELAGKPVTIEEIKDMLCWRFPDVEPDRIAQDVADALPAMLQIGIVKEVDES